MAVDVGKTSSSLPPPSAQSRDGLVYSRHYAQRIRDMGESSKESWIKKLWNHIVGTKPKKPDEETMPGGPETSVGVTMPSIPKSRSQDSLKNHSLTSSKTVLPPIRTTTPPSNRLLSKENTVVPARTSSGGSDRPTSQALLRQRTHVNPNTKSAPSPSKSWNDKKTKTLPPELGNSPYIPPWERPLPRQPTSKNHSGRERQIQKYKDGVHKPTPSHPYLSRQQETWRPRITRGVSTIKLEKRAKATSEKAMKNTLSKSAVKPCSCGIFSPYLAKQQKPRIWRPINRSIDKKDGKRMTSRPPEPTPREAHVKRVAEQAIQAAKIFSCGAPYPVDAYVRFSLRKRGWVEKFGPKASQAPSTNTTSSKLECEDDDDFKTICEQAIPLPWEEDHGIYAMMSRIVRHYPAKFIWGGPTAVNSMILRSEVIVNHFPKARHFSSKVGITNSLRELSWLNSADPSVFFPRCYVLSEDDKEDIIEDFRLTACISLLKWVRETYISRKDVPKDDLKLHRENTKYEEVTYNEEENKKKYGAIFEDPFTPRLAFSSRLSNHHDTDDINKDLIQPKDNKDSTASPADENNSHEIAADQSSSTNQSEISLLSAGQGQDKSSNQSQISLEDGQVESNTSRTDSEMTSENDVRPNNGEVDEQALESDIPEPEKTPEKVLLNKRGQPRVAPDIESCKVERKGGEVPLKAVEWALQHCDRYLRFREHEDIDIYGKKKGLSQAQWNQLLQWYYQVAYEGATVPITESKLRESDEVLKKLKKTLPQCNIDGKRNIWIVKPGDKSKGIGIEFSAKLDDILKYINNSTTQGTYVLQKYIERPLLIYNCKFDIRQWFVVTDWNPLTIWFYKDSYLRICSQVFNYNSLHVSVHLSNVAVQENYLNGKRSDKLPDNNFMGTEEFKKYLSDMGAGHAWDDIVYPGMKNAVINTLLATQDVAEHRKSAFELYGADFLIGEDFAPWLLEINASPGMAPSSKEKAKLCAAVIEDTIKVVLDRREMRNCSTGRFELAFRDTPVSLGKCVESKLLLEGQRIRKTDLQRYTMLDQKNLKSEKDRIHKEKLRIAREEYEKELEEKLLKDKLEREKQKAESKDSAQTEQGQEADKAECKDSNQTEPVPAGEKKNKQEEGR